MAQAQGLAGQARRSRFKLDHVMEDVRNQIELLKSNVAQLKVEEANLTLAESDYERGNNLVGKGAISQQDFDRYKAALKVAINRVSSAKQSIQQTRVSLGLPINHENPLDMPEDLDETSSVVQEALAELYGNATQLGFTPPTWNGDAEAVQGGVLLAGSGQESGPDLRAADSRVAGRQAGRGQGGSGPRRSG